MDTSLYQSTLDVCNKGHFDLCENRSGNTAILIVGQCRSLTENLQNILDFIKLYSNATQRYYEVFFYLDPHINFPWQTDASLRTGDLCTIRLDLAIRKVFPNSHISYYNSQDIHAIISTKKLNEASYLYFQSLIEHQAWKWAQERMPNITHVFKLRPDATYDTSINMSLFYKYEQLVFKDWDMCFHCTKPNADIICNQISSIENLNLQEITESPLTIHNIHYTHLLLHGVPYKELKFCKLNRNIPSIITSKNIISSQSNTYIPLGIQCAPTEFLKKNHLRQCAFPFDWMFSNISFIINILQNETFTVNNNSSFICYEHFNTCSNGMNVCDTNFNVLYPHHTINDLQINGCYHRRLERLKKTLFDDTCKIFIHITEISDCSRFTLDGKSPNKFDQLHMLKLCNYFDDNSINYKIIIFDFVSRYISLSHSKIFIIPLTGKPTISSDNSPFLHELDSIFDALVIF
uniref:Uncharacterized protein n=1 Tax=viral metagenome TaxID=1070528 RepID=A0A6C0F5Q9_9ZZZZ|tara:strand:- start:24703 stop:26088 length:1386 start_codon:yes stop_codon:yes gene_type:complete